jgi:hypothetical protein
MTPARRRARFALLAGTCLVVASLAIPASAEGIAALARLDVARLLETARALGLAAAERGIPAEDSADAACLLLRDALAARHENPALIDRLSETVRIEMLGAAPASAPLEVGPLRVSRHVAREVLGSRPGRERLAVLGRLRGALPAQASSMTDEDLLLLLPELVRDAEPVAVPAELLGPLRSALSTEDPQ